MLTAALAVAATLPTWRPAAKGMESSRGGERDGGLSRRLTLEDIVTRRVPEAPTLSPDGRRLAFVVRSASTESNRYGAELAIVPVGATGEPAGGVQVWARAAAITTPRWRPDGSALAFLSTDGGATRLLQVGVNGGEPVSVLRHPPGGDLVTYAWSPDGLRIALVVRTPADTAAERAARDRGVLFDDETMSGFDLLYGRLHARGSELWVADVRGGTSRRLWSSDADIGGLAWSPNGARIALDDAAPPLLRRSMVHFNRDVGIVDVSSGQFVPVGTGEAAESGAAWSPSGDAIAFVSAFNGHDAEVVVQDLVDGRRATVGHDALGWPARILSWDGEAGSMLVETRDSADHRRTAPHAPAPRGVYRLTLATGALERSTDPDERHSGCSASRSGALLACVREDVRTPPDPVLVDIARGTVQRAATMNPAYATMRLGAVRPLAWTNEYGAGTDGYLILPPDSTAAAPYPLVVITYGFDGQFIDQAAWITSAPAQPLATDGFAVRRR